MLSNKDLAHELAQLAQVAGRLAERVKSDGDLPARALAELLVATGKLHDKLSRMSGQLETKRK
jgi:hypothetical protein